MIILGLTGGIGSGKSTIARIFEELGVPVYYADIEAKKFLDEEPVKNELRKLWGNRVLDAENKVDKAVLASIVFKDEKELAKLNALIHPLLEEDFKQWVQKQNAAPYVVKEAAILFEAGFDKNVDRVLSVTAPVEQRIARVMERDHVNRQQVLDRVSKQWTDEMRAEKSDYIIRNSDTDMVLEQVFKLHEQLMYESET
jgi:dephospho-CoA kinase